MSKLIKVDFSKRAKDLRVLKKQRTLLKKWDNREWKFHKLLRRTA